jgi:general secretion pathway protein A
MYNRHFGLTEDPFSIAANPRFVYLSACHREALAHLLYGLRSDSGFVLLSGEIGAGKTTMCRCLLERLPEHTDVAFILNPRVTVVELLSSICDELHINAPEGVSVKAYVDVINQDLLSRHAAGRSTVVIVDEAQNLSYDVLEQLRLLTNLETTERKLLRIILIGQPELDHMLRRPEFRQLEQRITARFHLGPLAKTEIQPYISHRLAVAGCDEPVFSAAVVARIFDHTGGIPRRINKICDRSLLGAYVRSKRRVDHPILKVAAREVEGRPVQTKRRRPALAASVLLVCVTVLIVVQTDRLKPGRWITEPVAMASALNFGAGGMLEKADDATKSDSENTAISFTSRQGMVADNELLPWPKLAKINAATLNAAYATQFDNWGLLPAPTSDSLCGHAERNQLICFKSFANLASLANYDRPAILTFHTQSGEAYYLTLVKLDDRSATLMFPGGPVRVGLKDIEARWRGEFRLLWRTAPQGANLLMQGSSGPAVSWLTEALIGAGLSGVEKSESFNGAVVRAVQRFQQAHGLKADGIVGRQTIIQLNTMSVSGIPRLVSHPLSTLGAHNEKKRNQNLEIGVTG